MTYVIGPGFGESQVVLLPSGHCLVIDCCTKDGENLTLSLLRELEVPQVDLLVVTHPDLDHLRGIPALTTAFPPKQIWRFPFGGLRELVSAWCRLDPNNRHLEEVDAAFARLEELEEQGTIVWEAGIHSHAWIPDPTIEVTCLAPTGSDKVHARKWLGALVSYLTNTGYREKARDEPVLGSKVRDYLLGTGSLDDRPNVLSLAVALRWRTRRLLFCGDVENGRPSERSGWKGILRQLRDDHMLDRVAEVDFIKVAHHGSDGAFHLPAWQLHQRPDGTTIAAVTPFNRSNPPLPREEVLTSLHAHAARLCITEDARDVFARAQKTGWVKSSVTLLPTLGPHLAVVLAEGGPAALHVGSRAGIFQRP